MHNTSSQQVRPRRWRHWYWFPALLIVALTLRAWSGRNSNRLLEKFAAAGYPTTPAALNEWYPSVPEDENAALSVLDAIPGMESELKASGRKTTKLNRPAMLDPWDPESLEIARKLRDINAKSLVEIHGALQKPKSRYPVNLRKGFATLLPQLSEIKMVCNHLVVAAELSAMETNSAAATEHLLDAIKLARTLDNEPLMISMLLRIAALSMVEFGLERSFSQCSFRSEECLRLQEALLSALEPKVFERAMVGEMVIGYAGIQDPLSAGVMGGPGGPTKPVSAILMSLYSGLGLKHADSSFLLHRMDEILEASKLDYPQRSLRMDAVEIRIQTAKRRIPPAMVAGMLLPALAKMDEKDVHIATSLRVAAVAMAVERYRLDHQAQLPASLSELAPKYLREIPTDPANGKPLLLKSRKKGFVVYGVGPNLSDDGGTRRNLKSAHPETFDVVFEIIR